MASPTRPLASARGYHVHRPVSMPPVGPTNDLVVDGPFMVGIGIRGIYSEVNDIYTMLFAPRHTAVFLFPDIIYTTPMYYGYYNHVP